MDGEVENNKNNNKVENTYAAYKCRGNSTLTDGAAP